MLTQLSDTLVGDLHTLATFERKRLGDDSNSQDAHLARDLCDHRQCTCSGATTHACSNEKHISAVDDTLDAVTIFERCLTTDFRVGTCAQTFSNALTDMQDCFCGHFAQRLSVRVGADELYAFDV